MHDRRAGIVGTTASGVVYHLSRQLLESQPPGTAGGPAALFRGVSIGAGSHWVVPGVYSCGKALVVDFCRQVEPEAMESFMEKWHLGPENDSTENFTKEEALRLEVESPVWFFFPSYCCGERENIPGQPGLRCRVSSLCATGGHRAGGVLGRVPLRPGFVQSLAHLAVLFPMGLAAGEVESLSFELKAEKVVRRGVFQIQPG